MTDHSVKYRELKLDGVKLRLTIVSEFGASLREERRRVA